ncbi:MAG: hypothetical protein HPY68_04665 [Candidatus Atribacteria bacterium]|nr:hypothetical protein [Candidatus Atribacteria bacterium]
MEAVTPQEKVQEVLSSYEIKRLDGGRWSVRHPKMEEAYIVDPEKGTCTCKAGVNGQVCRHLSAIRVKVEEERSKVKRVEEEKKEGEADLLKRFLNAEEEKLLRTLTPEWIIKLLKAVSSRVLEVESTVKKIRGEEAEKSLERLLE